MGRLVKQDLGISLEMLNAILAIYETELADDSVSQERKIFVIVCAASFIMLWVGALREEKFSWYLSFLLLPMLESVSGQLRRTTMRYRLRPTRNRVH